MPRKLKAAGSCPRCHLPFKSVRVQASGGRAYAYIYHGKEGGKEKRCYIGPVEGYVAVSRVKSGEECTLRNLQEESVEEIKTLVEALWQRRRAEAQAEAELEAKIAVYKRVIEELLELKRYVESVVESARREAAPYALKDLVEE